MGKQRRRRLLKGTATIDRGRPPRRPPFNTLSCMTNTDDLIDLNADDGTALLYDLADIEGIGTTTARQIREGQPYDSKEDLLDARGVGPAAYDKVKDHVYVDLSELDPTHEEALELADEVDDLWRLHDDHVRIADELESGYITQLVEQKFGDEWAVTIIPTGLAGGRARYFDGDTEEDETRRYTGTEERARQLFSRCADDINAGLVPDPLATRHQHTTEAADASTDYKTRGGWDRAKIMRRGHEIAHSLDADRDYSDRLSEGLARAWDEAKADRRVDAEAGEWRCNDTDMVIHLHDQEVDAEVDAEAEVPRRRLGEVGAVEEEGESWAVKMRERGGRTWTLYLYHDKIVAGHPRRDAVAARGDAKRFIDTFDRMRRFEEARDGFNFMGVGMSLEYSIDEFRRTFRDHYPQDWAKVKEAFNIENPSLTSTTEPDPRRLAGAGLGLFSTPSTLK